jgi:kynurenine 3-monooxygenase
VGEAGAPTRSVTAHYDLLVGCDGADSVLRGLMAAAKAPKVRDFSLQTPSEDAASFVGFAGWIAAHVGELVPGFRSHRPRQYLYVMDAGNGAPRLELWIAAPGVMSGIVAWGGPKCEWTPDALCAALVAAYGARIPGYCLDDLAARACARGAPPPQRYGRTVMVSQFHGPRMVLLGDAAHAMTNATRQGLNCAVEGVRLLNVVLKISGDSVARAGNVLSEVRGEDAQSMQMLEQMQRTQAPGLKHGDALFAVSGWLSGLVWRAASVMAALLSLLLPGRVRADWVVVALRDCREGYAEVLKVLTRYAAGPILVAICAATFAMWEPLSDMIRGAAA